MVKRYVSTSERAAEKQASRDEDAADIASGRRTIAEVRQTNSIFANAKSVVVHIGKHKRPR